MILDQKQIAAKNEEPSWLNGPDSLPYVPVKIESSPQTISSASPHILNEHKQQEKSLLSTSSVAEEKAGSAPEKHNSRRSSNKVIVEVRDPDDDSCHCCCCKIDIYVMGFTIFHLIASLTCLASISANFYVFTDLYTEDNDLREVMLRIYAILFAVIAILAETNLDLFLKNFIIFQSWFVRGLWYSLIGLITVREQSPVGSAENVIGFATIAIGLAYAIMAIFRIKYMKSRMASHAIPAGYRNIV